MTSSSQYDQHVKRLKKTLDEAYLSLSSAHEIINLLVADDTPQLEKKSPENNDNFVEGVFNGRCMIDKNGKQYLVPENYASKTKLIEGDKMKVFFSENELYRFKQTKPVPRSIIHGKYIIENNKPHIIANKKLYQILPASVSFFGLNVGDSVTAIVSTEKQCSWAAIESVT